MYETQGNNSLCIQRDTMHSSKYTYLEADITIRLNQV